MNRFVNYGKRSVTLPKGCKDLIDVLQARRRSPASMATPGRATLAPDQGTLGDIAIYLARQLQTPSRFSNLLVLWGDALEAVQVPLTEAGLELFALIRPGGASEKAVQRVFERAGIGSAGGWRVDVFGTATQLLRYRLPNAAQSAAGLVREVLRVGYGLPENARLEFYYVEEPPA